MSLQDLKEAMPAYAKDIKLNLGSLMNETALNEQQKWGTFLASAMACRNAQVIKAIAAETAGLDEANANGAKAAAAIMGMNNIYYRFVHLASNKDYQTMPAKLRMQIIANHGVEKIDFELWSLAVSAINGCGMCVDAHEAELKKHGVTNDQIQTAARIAAVVHAAAQILDGEAALV